jgi:hypothetical protein
VGGDSVLVNFFYAPSVGHCLEALRYCLGYQGADTNRRIGLVLNSFTPVELAQFCSFEVVVFSVEFPLAQLPSPEASPDLSRVPREWDWVVDDHRRHLTHQGFAGFRHYYECADQHLKARLGHGAPATRRLPTGPTRACA